VFDRLQDAVLTHGAACDVEAGDAQHEIAHGFRGQGRRGRLGQERTTASERRRAASIGEQAEVTDADEVVRDDVEQDDLAIRNDAIMHGAIRARILTTVHVIREKTPLAFFSKCISFQAKQRREEE
jgi:hypothetical protein